MVGSSEGAVRTSHLESALCEHSEGIARAVVDEMAIDMQQGGSIRSHHDCVGRPDLVEDGARHARYSAASAAAAEPWKRPLTASHSSAPTRRNTSRTGISWAG